MSLVRKEIEEYCKLNGIKDRKGFIEYLLKKGFFIEKYGLSPNGADSKSKFTENEGMQEVSEGEENINDSNVEGELKSEIKPKSTPKKVKIIKNKN